MELVLDIVKYFILGYLLSYTYAVITDSDMDVWMHIAAGCVMGILSFGIRFLSGSLSYVYIIIMYGLAIFAGKSKLSKFDIIGGLSYAVTIFLFGIGGEKLLSPQNGLSPIFQIIGVLAVLAIKKAMATHALSSESCIKKVELISSDGRVIRCKGYLDTGNTLLKNGKPICVVSEDIAHKIGRTSSEKMEVYTIGGVKLLPVIPIEIKVYDGRGGFENYQTNAVVTRHMSRKGCKVILNKYMK